MTLVARPWLTTLMMGALAGLLGACGNPLGLGEVCNRSIRDNPPKVYTDGTVDHGVYQTSAWDGEWLDFPGGTHYALQHKLGGTPPWIVPYLSFSSHGIGDGVVDGGQVDGGLASPAAGDGIGIIDVDDEYITVVNASCVNYSLRVVAMLGPAPEDAEDAGAE
jgi:hypothetical protein